MDNKNNALGSANNITDMPPITPRTKLGEVIAMLNLTPGQKKPDNTPTPKFLLETAGEPLAAMNDCTLFRNGFAIYQNCTGRTVVWLPYCTSFTYYFGKLRDAEKDTLSETFAIPDGELEKMRWMIPVTLIGDHCIERNSMNRTGSRKNTVDLASKDNGDKDDEMEKAVADPLRRAFNWYDGRMGENPLEALERKETREEMLATMTEKQREVFIMYYRDAMTQEQIAATIGVSRPAVTVRLSYALEVARKFL